MECEKCKQEVGHDEIHVHHGNKLCDECYMDLLQRPKTCGDILKASSAIHERENL